MSLIIIQQALAQAQEKLTAIADNPALEAELLLAHALNKPRSYLHTWPTQSIPDDALTRFQQNLKRRCNKEPIAYIIGAQEFWSLPLIVTPDTLIPRPETELLVELVLTTFPECDTPRKIADLGTGSGAIALALANERPQWQIHAVDCSDKALQIAQKNAEQLGFHHISFHHGNWCTALPETDFDAIISNPPYIAETEWAQYADGLAFEPYQALVSGKDGLEAIREISQAAAGYLKPGGALFIEHGFLQGAAVREIVAAAGYVSIQTIRDLSGQERVTVGYFG
ncbi:MAG: peptide chain release factor N(5)-glutamine methyltransferase [Gammaproteobacteria bacterium]|nr:MAG: peptide chain release factor N(5)-glutamine methyltransferase [Gammaproteobacteria bacterium]